MAIVGGGASGTLTAVHLLRHAATSRAPLRVVLVDRDGRHGTGQAYATSDPDHLLNACVDKMSAIADDPGHLLRWARANGLDVAGSDFLPRAVYGRYLRDVLTAAESHASPASPMTRVTAEVSAVSRSFRGRPAVHLSGGGRIDADAVVLALGNTRPSPLPQVAEVAGGRYVGDPWAPGALARIGDGTPVLVVGTGLTMIDVAISATRAHPGATVYALSRHGLLPRAHRCPAGPPAPMPIPDDATRLADLLRAVRAAVTAGDGDWHSVVDGLRPHVPALWGRLSLDDRRRFLALVARYWEVHRHRIPPSTASRVSRLRAAGRLHIVRGRLAGTTAVRDGLVAHVDEEGTPRDLRVGWVVNGTGPSADVSRDPFLSGLFAAGLCRPDPLGLGLDADDAGAVLDARGRPSEKIFTLGPTLRGTRYETTAIPEIRTQAAGLAPRLVAAAGSGIRPYPPVHGTGRPRRVPSQA
ncbi:hydroxyacylglutathione hydrolase [Planotetraspora phitsanulokensis]|uniref:Hydroxyacylglutathione hydrolase n=1 Tax=Planotetraspora phitsanulokensis TaxID=575192 RepID=A0A8J3XII1_9ACTN|nr:hydroxyacylglutathione hydrolase [Planotetraspora phitsanulokensis]